MARERLRFDVFGRRIDVERTVDGWAAYLPGNDGKRRSAQIPIPADMSADEIGRYLADVLHESATPKRPNVRQLPS